MYKHFTCGNCENVCKTKGQFQIIGCKLTGKIIPHHAIYPEYKVTFTRIPTGCPMPDDTYFKSESPALEQHHVTLKISDVKVGLK